MNRRNIAMGIGSVAGSLIFPPARIAFSQSATTTTQDSWQDDNEEVLVEWEASLFQEPGETGTDAWQALTLNIVGPKNLLSIWVSVFWDAFQSAEEIREYVHNDVDLMYGLDGTENVRFEVVEDNGAFGVLYRPVYEGREDLWVYEELLPASNSHPPIQLWINGIRSGFDRDAIHDALSSLKIDGEDAIRAIGMNDLLDHIESMDVT